MSMALTALPSLYQIKKTAMLPRKLLLRHREKLEPGFLRSALELHYYRPAFYRWLAAVSANPDLLFDADISSDSLVLDVGAYHGEWSMEIFRRYQPRVIAFEPDPRNFRKLEDVTSGEDRIQSFPYGLGGRDEERLMSLKFLGSTVFDEKPEDGVDQVPVELRDISRVWQELELGQVELMKINIEGAEFPLLERMQASGLLSRVNCFLIQFHEWHPGAYRRRRQLQRELRKSHELIWDHHFIWEKWQLKHRTA